MFQTTAQFVLICLRFNPINEFSIIRILNFSMQNFKGHSLKKNLILTILCWVLGSVTPVSAAELQVSGKISWHSEGTDVLPIIKSVSPLDQLHGPDWVAMWVEIGSDELMSVDWLRKDTKRQPVGNRALLSSLPSELTLKFSVHTECKKNKVFIKIQALAQNALGAELLESFDLKIVTKAKSSGNLRKKSFASNSVLASGDWYKIATTQNGIHRIDYNFLKNLGINPDQINPQHLKLYGNGAGMVPAPVSDFRYDDLHEIPVFVQGEQDGRFNTSDFLLFYGQSQTDRWTFNAQSGTYSHQYNFFSDTTYYFLHVGSAPGKRISTVSESLTENRSTSSGDFTYLYENERVNLTKSGKVWLGEEFDRVLTQSFSLSIQELQTAEPLRLVSSVTSRSIVPSTFNVIVNGTPVLSHSMIGIVGGYDKPFTSGLNYNAASFSTNASNLQVTYTYNKPASGSIGWLDFFELSARVNLRNISGNFLVRDKNSVGAGNVTKYSINSSRALRIWDVSNPVEPFEIGGTLAGNTFSFLAKSDSLRTFSAFDGSNFLQPKSVGKILNQNLHGLPLAEGIIISYPDFLVAAEKLAKFHRERSGQTIHVINVTDIYNEFGSGSQDISAIRDFLRMFYERGNGGNKDLKQVLLMGRASYDYKYRIKSNSNFIPVFESFESFDPTESYCSDDFIGFLDDGEGRWDMGSDAGELMDIGLGRLPVSSSSEADALVEKLISYTQSSAFGDWRNRMVFMADDEDFNIHQNQSNNLANTVGTRFPEYNIQKIFLDAYQRESTSGGARYPEANKALNNAIEKGCLIYNYTGHGGEVGLTAERVLGIEDINSWSNKDKLALFITATCEFSRFDDPGRVSAGEQVLLSTKGGGIGLFTTVRLVYSGQNEILNDMFFRNAGFDSASQVNPPSLGTVSMKTKNAYLNKNTRNFTFLGDPFLSLAYPRNRIIPVSVNGKPFESFSDTLKALEKVTITGIVTDRLGNVLTDFNGEVFPLLLDKAETYKTLVNNPAQSYLMEFAMQNNVLYRGRATVSNGNFSFSFIIPKDISYQYGLGKFSAYAFSSTTDATGFNKSLVVGGTGDSVGLDKNGPVLNLFMNDEKFVNGGITDENPTFIGKLFDDNGINTTGRGIGRDLTLVLNNETSKSIVLNDYYQATLNSYQSGEVRYQFRGLSPGKHSLKFRAFDAFNNPAEASLDFEVRPQSKPELQHVLNYPNPFTRNTVFHFDHNQAGQMISVLIQVFTVTGQLVKTLNWEGVATGNHFQELSWNGNDDYGDRIGTGVYVYKVRLKSTADKPAEQFQKLVIFN